MPDTDQKLQINIFRLFFTIQLPKSFRAIIKKSFHRFPFFSQPFFYLNHFPSRFRHPSPTDHFTVSFLPVSYQRLILFQMSRRSLRVLDTGDILKLLEGDESELSGLSSDDEYLPDPDLVCGPCEASEGECQPGDAEETQSHDVSQPEAASASSTSRLQRTYRWRKKTFEPPQNVDFTGVLPPSDGDGDPLSYFKKFVTDEMLAMVATETNRYSVEKTGQSVNTTAKELEQVLGMYLLMGLSQMPSVRAYWEAETYYAPVADVMSRNRFEKLLTSLHFQDNNASEDVKRDKAWKIRPWLSSLRERCLQTPPEECHAIDEMMVAFKGRSHMKVYMPAKPKKWGFKMWGRAGVSGFLYDFDLHTGAADKSLVTELGVTGDLVMQLASTLPSGVNHKLFADNYFTSIPVVEELQARGIQYLGTVRGNRLKGCVMKDEKTLKSEGRGSSDHRVEELNNCVAVRWYDNRVVNLLSSYVGTEPVTVAKRWDRKKKVHVEVPMPAIVQVYNKFMGGIDLLDMMTSMYKYSLKSRRWYLYVFWHTVTIALVNGWLLHRRHHDQPDQDKSKLALRRFQATVAGCLISVGKKARGRPPKRDDSASSSSPAPTRRLASSSRGAVSNVLRFDSIDHFPQYTEERQRCRLCRNAVHFSYIKCEKCKVHLCLNKARNCFAQYHGKF